MSGFTYYRPGQLVVSKMEQIENLGLAYAFDKPPAVSQTQHGPDGNAGCTFARSSLDVGHYADRQTWRQIPGSDAWVGMNKVTPPKPLEDLARPHQISGHSIKLDDGGLWLIPCARRYTLNGGAEPSVKVNLPYRYSYDSEGKWTESGVKRQYAELWRLACEYEDAFLAALDGAEDGSEEILIEFDQMHLLAVTAIRTNYYVSESELDLLAVYDQDARDLIIDALRDMPTLKKWAIQKKTIEAHVGGNS